MTPARKKALQWFYDQGEASNDEITNSGPSKTMIRKMLDDLQLQAYTLNGVWHMSLTDAGRRALNGDSK